MAWFLVFVFLSALNTFFAVWQLTESAMAAWQLATAVLTALGAISAAVTYRA
jgi:hypothetical protein